MAQESYLKEAFLMPQNLVGLGVGVVAAAVLPFAGAIVLGVGIAEAIYLKTMSSNARFQRMVRSRKR